MEGRFTESENEEIEKISKELIGKSTNELFFELRKIINDSINNLKEKLLDINIFDKKQIFLDTILIDKEEEYKYNGVFFPIIDKNKINLENYDNVYLEDVFLDLDYLELENISNLEFEGWIKINDEEERIIVVLEEDRRYIEELEKFYKTFEINGVNWETINIALMKRAYRIKLIKYNFEIDNKILNKINKENCEIDYFFDGYEGKILRKKSILWNVQKKQILASMFLRPTKKSIFYEYVLNINPEEKVLVHNNSQNKILFCYPKGKDKINIISKNEREELWSIYLVKDKKSCENILQNNNFFDKKEVLRFNNYKESTFIDELIKRNYNEKFFRNKVDIEKMFFEYENIENKLKLRDIVIGKNFEKNIILYNSNFFIDDKFSRMGKNNKIKLNIFVEKIGNDKYFHDNFSFIISSIQKKYFEYNVEGYLYE